MFALDKSPSTLRGPALLTLGFASMSLYGAVALDVASLFPVEMEALFIRCARPTAVAFVGFRAAVDEDVLAIMLLGRPKNEVALFTIDDATEAAC